MKDKIGLMGYNSIQARCQRSMNWHTHSVCGRAVLCGCMKSIRIHYKEIKISLQHGKLRYNLHRGVYALKKRLKSLTNRPAPGQ